MPAPANKIANNSPASRQTMSFLCLTATALIVAAVVVADLGT